MATKEAMTPRAVSERIGREYVEADSLPAEGTDRCESVYNQLADRVIDLYNEIPVPVVFQSDDPYTSYTDMAETVGREQMLRVYDGHADSHPYFSASVNLKFRAVHDWHGHLRYDTPFTAVGEFTKWFGMSDHFSDDVNRALFAEVCGQVGEVHYLDDGFESDRYQQRAFLAPEQWVAEMSVAVFSSV